MWLIRVVLYCMWFTSASYAQDGNKVKDEGMLEDKTTAVYYTRGGDSFANISGCHAVCENDGESCMAFTYYYDHDGGTSYTKRCNLRKYPCDPRNLRMQYWKYNERTGAVQQSSYCERIVPNVPGYWPPSRHSCTDDDIYRYARKAPADIPECAKLCRGDDDCKGFYYYHWTGSGITQVQTAQTCAILSNLCPLAKITDLGIYYLFYEKIDRSPSSFLENFTLIDFITPDAITVGTDKDAEPDQERIEKCAEFCLQQVNATTKSCKGFFWAADPMKAGNPWEPTRITHRCIRAKEVLLPENWIPDTSYVYYLRKTTTHFVPYPNQLCAHKHNVYIGSQFESMLKVDCEKKATQDNTLVAYAWIEEPHGSVYCYWYFNYFPCNYMHAAQFKMKGVQWKPYAKSITYVRNDIEMTIPQHVKSKQPGYDVFYSQSCVDSRIYKQMPGPHTEAQCAQRCTDADDCEGFSWCETSQCESPYNQCHLGNAFCTPLYPSVTWHIYVKSVEIEGFTTHYATTCLSPLNFTIPVYHDHWGSTLPPPMKWIEKSNSPTAYLCAEECRNAFFCRSFFFSFNGLTSSTTPCHMWSRVCHPLAMATSTDQHYFVRNYAGTKSDHIMGD